MIVGLYMRKLTQKRRNEIKCFVLFPLRFTIMLFQIEIFYKDPLGTIFTHLCVQDKEKFQLTQVKRNQPRRNEIKCAVLFN